MEINVDLQEYIDVKVKESQLRIEIKLAAIEKAIELQAGKDQDHFEELNHAKALLQEDRQRYLPRETYAADRKDKTSLTISFMSIGISIILFVLARLIELNTG